MRRFDAPDMRRNAGGRLLIAPDGRTLYLVDQARNALTAFDPQSGRAGVSLDDVRGAALSPNGTTIYVSGDKRLAAYRADGLEPLWSTAVERVRGLVVGADGVRLAGYRFGPQATLMTFDAATGQTLRSLEIKDSEPRIAAGPGGGWFVRASLTTPRLLRFSPDLKVEAEVEVVYGHGMIHDAARKQVFERGEMLWREGERAVYVLQAGDGWQRHADTWQEGLPEFDPAIAAPAGLQQPVRGFGKVWREQLGGPAAAVGWAKDREQGIAGRVQAWEGGATIRLGGRQIVLFSGGEWR